MSDQNYINRFLERQGKGHHQIGQCCLCGHLEWRATYTNKPDGYSLSTIQPSYCPKCQEVLQRSPEIMQWVVNVISHAFADPKSMTRHD